MKTKQIIAIAVAVLAILGIYFGTTNVKPAEHDEHDGHQHEMAKGPMMGGDMMPAADFDSLVADIKKRLLSPQVKAEVENYEQQIAAAKDNGAKIAAYEALGKRWQSSGNKGIAAHYFEKAGDLENSEKKLNFAAHLYEEGMNSTENPGIRKLYADGRVAALNRVMEINPQSDSTQIDLALAMIDRGDMMNGVLKLRDFSDKHPENIRAQITLGKLALQTNQGDKALGRAETVLKLDPNNAEAYLVMGEAYIRLNKIDKAEESFKRAGAIIKNPNFDKDMEAYIAKFKKQQP